MRTVKVEILKSIILNIGLLVVLAQILARIRLVKKYIVRDNHTLKDNIALIIIFGMISVISTYTGYGVRGAIANTRVIGVMAGGFIGGPIVGIGAGIIGGVHRFLIDMDGFASVSCTISTILEGILSAATSKYIKKNKYKGADIFVVTFLAEILQMIIILIFAKPYSDAIKLVQDIAIPMVVLNPLGMVLFVSVFNFIFKEKEYEIGKKVSLAFDITKQCLPLLRTGLYNKENCEKTGNIILEYSKDLAVLFTDHKEIISISGKKLNSYIKDLDLPGVAKQVFEEKQVCIAETAEYGDPLHKALEKMVAIGAPLSMNGKVFGCMIIFTHKLKISINSDIQFADGLSKLFSVQYELSENEKQKELLEKAEFHALQSQINPHFIFNSLNTISAFCREKPDKARELLIALATYFRNSIQTQDGFVSIYDEMEYVEAYLQLEKARFDDRLLLTIELPNNLKCKMPCLILQPIVENAVKHGAMKRKQGIVQIIVEEEDKYIKISVCDNGLGMPQQIIDGLKNNTLASSKIGLSNVQRRLCYLYGAENGLDIHSSPNGTIINIYIPNNREKSKQPTDKKQLLGN